MNNNVLHKGLKWHKCDFHLHTPASNCFLDKEITPEEWVSRAIEQELDCVAVTDHNTYLWIDKIKEAAKGTGLTVFPGVEITCDTSKVHLLIIFDTCKTSDDVRNFLIRAGFNGDSIDNSEAFTSNSIFDIAELAKKEGAITIPAHIDSFAGLGGISFANLRDFFSKDYINAVQVVHKEFLDSNLISKENIELKDCLIEYYDGKPIDHSTITNWHNVVKSAIDTHCSILTFSDNPSAENKAKHGLHGIGSNYSWIKMDQEPSLEGIRQSFLLPKLRIKNKFESPMSPFKLPPLWIKSIKVNNSTITDHSNPFEVIFSPQLNTIVGGRGSGKSSILRFIRGVFNRTEELKELVEILEDHNNFYTRTNPNTNKGVLKQDTNIEIEFIRNNILHKIISTNIQDSSNQDIQILKFDYEGNDWEEIYDSEYMDFFEFEHYSQKQIFEIAQKPNALRERIDKAIVGMNELKIKRNNINKEFLETSASIRTINSFISEKIKIEIQIKDLDSNIKKLQASGIADLLTEKESFIKEEHSLNEFKSSLKDKKEHLELLIGNFNINDIDYSLFSKDSKLALEPISHSLINKFNIIKDSLEDNLKKIIDLEIEYEQKVNVSQWKQKYSDINALFKQKKNILEESGIDDILSFERFMGEKSMLEDRLSDINSKLEQRENLLQKRADLNLSFLDISKEITTLRASFLKKVVTDDKISVKILPFRNKDDFQIQLRKILQRENNTFKGDIDKLIEIVFNGNVQHKIIDFRNEILSIRNNNDTKNEYSSRFIDLIKGMDDAQIDAIELLLPEDEIEIKYRANDNSPFQLLSTASPGQKTTAILTLILSYGNIPLILDQPEDDLDNRLVYDLIVDRLSQAKEERQLIVVTHNANIPVNSDAEFIISMSSNENILKILTSGTVDKNDIKKEICDVMEGGEKAFNMRFERYK